MSLVFDPFDYIDIELWELSNLMFDGTIDEEQVALLELRLSENENTRLAYLMCMDLHAQLLWSRRGESLKDLVCAESIESETMLSELNSMDFEDHETELVDLTQLINDRKLQERMSLKDQASLNKNSTTQINDKKQIVISWGAVYSGVALLAAMFVLVVLPMFKVSQVETGPIRKNEIVVKPEVVVPRVASLVETFDAVWAQDFSAVVGAELKQGSYVLQRGSVELEFKQGARVIIEAPAEFKLVGQNSGFLKFGVLTAYVPEGAKGFSINTPVGLLVDLGTRFGVNVDSNGETRTRVFEGEIIAKTYDTPNEGSVILNLKSDEGAKIDSSGGELGLFDVDRTQFMLTIDSAKLEPVASGDIEYLNSPPWTVLKGQYERNHKMQLFLEQSNVVLEKSLMVYDEFFPKEHESMPEANVKVLAKTKVDSYLLHFDPPGQDIEFKQGTARINFNRKVIGFIITNKPLVETSEIFGSTTTVYFEGGNGVDRDLGIDGLEGAWDIDANSFYKETKPDIVEISTDGMGVFVTLGVHNGTDNLRILVESVKE